MIFTNKIYPRPVAEMILDRTKTQTRRLVEEGDEGIYFSGKLPDKLNYLKVNFKGGRLKWKVGQDYSVQPGRGKAGLWYCPKCKYVFDDRLPMICYECEQGSIPFKPLRIKITDIRKEHLCNISEEDAIAEGTGSGDSLRTANQKYVETFITKVAWNKVPTDLKKRFGKERAFCIATRWNPKVWVLKW